MGSNNKIGYYMAAKFKNSVGHTPVTRKKTSQGTPGRGRMVRQATSTLNKHKRRSQSRYRGQGR